ncbi:MAG: hypothetical protein M3P23_02690, partial [Actinomycetota bacterium]|nr:hypothetical protein [Actinomycetota bacterium]
MSTDDQPTGTDVLDGDSADQPNEAAGNTEPTETSASSASAEQTEAGPGDLAGDAERTDDAA